MSRFVKEISFTFKGIRIPVSPTINKGSRYAAEYPFESFWGQNQMWIILSLIVIIILKGDIS